MKLPGSKDVMFFSQGFFKICHLRVSTSQSLDIQTPPYKEFHTQNIPKTPNLRRYDRLSRPFKSDVLRSFFFHKIFLAARKADQQGVCLADAEALPMDLLRRLQGVEATNIKHLSMQQARVISLRARYARWFLDLSRIS